MAFGGQGGVIVRRIRGNLRMKWITHWTVLSLLIGAGTFGFADDSVLPSSTSNQPTLKIDAQAPTTTGGESDGFDRAILPYLTKHCLRCHGAQVQKGELRIDTLSRDFLGGGSAAHWGDVMYRISSADMPPPEEPQPSADEAAQVADWLNARIKEGETARLAKREKVTFQKLTREEYANTIYDLLGVHYDAADPGALSEDPNWHGFERIGSVLSLSPAHVEKYFAAGEAVLAEAFPESEPKKTLIKWDPSDFRHIRDKQKLIEQGLWSKVRLDVWAGSTFTGHPGSVQHLHIPIAGDYKVRIKLSGLKPPTGRAPHMTVYAANLDRMLHEQDVIAPEDQPITVEFLTHFTAGTHVIRTTNEVPAPSNLGRAGRSGAKPFFSIKDGRFPWQRKLTDEEGQPIEPFLLVDWVEWEGPVLPAFPTKVQQEFALPNNDASQSREVISRFVERALRRPARPAEIDRLNALMQSEIAKGAQPTAALKTAFLAVLCMKDFFYLVEGSPIENQRKINDWELASRLSYFLWSTMPDAELRAAAANGTLHQPEVLQKQIARMLNDPKIEQFTNGFARQWLQLRSVGMFQPDKKLYPDYDDFLQKSMIGESTAFFHQVLKQNLSLKEFLESDWTMCNARLALHYQIPGVNSDGFERIPLSPDSHRGGLLTQASILTLTSDGTRHRPVHRGKWVLESIIGRSPPPPPANVKPVEPTPATQPKATLRMKLAAHQNDANCAACHKKIDPLGFAFDNYDAIGRWRTQEAVRDGNGQDPVIDASGQLVDGRKFQDAAGLKQILVADLDLCATAGRDN
jgi:mono/diheme cytochrome c family protein